MMQTFLVISWRFVESGNQKIRKTVFFKKY